MPRYGKVNTSSSLSKANESRDYRIFEELGMWLIRKVRPVYAKEDIPEVYLPGWEIFAIDSTTIPCSIKLAEWALGKYSKGGVEIGFRPEEARKIVEYTVKAASGFRQ